MNKQIIQENAPAEFRYLVELLRKALAAEKLPEPIEGMNYLRLLNLAKRQMVAATVFSVLPMEHMPSEAYRAWKQHTDYTVRKEVLYQVERNSIVQDFEAMGIDCLLLKGIYMRQIYGKIPREFADNDLLIHPADENRVAIYLRSKGYIETFGTVHNVYTKPPVFNFEIHKSLLEPNNTGYQRYQSVWHRAVALEGMSHCFKMSDMDFYLFGCLHIYKHAKGAGISLRNLLDFWMMHQYFQDEVEKIQNVFLQNPELECVSEFYRELVDCTEMLFSADEPLTNQQMLALWKIVDYGTWQHLIDNRIRTLGKFEYLFSRLIPSNSEMIDRFPILRKQGWLMLFLRIYRGVKLFFRRDTLYLMFYALRWTEKEDDHERE